MTAVDAAVAEIEAALAVARPQLQGLQFFLRLDQSESTKTVLELARVGTDRRIQLLEAALTTLNALLTDEYPEVPIREVPDSILADLQADLAVEASAFALFASDKAVHLNTKAGTAEPKD